MPQLLCDAGALVKRYLTEAGSDTVDALWAAVDVTRMVTTLPGYVEAAAILRRKRNSGVLHRAAFGAGRSLLQQEVLQSGSLVLLPLDAVMLSAIRLIDRHNVNAPDVAILAAFLRLASASTQTCLLVASDKRLLRAALAEGLAVLNPEIMPATDVSAFLASL